MFFGHDGSLPPPLDNSLYLRDSLILPSLYLSMRQYWGGMDRRWNWHHIRYRVLRRQDFMISKFSHCVLLVALVLSIQSEAFAAQKKEKPMKESSVKNESLITLSQADRFTNNLAGEGSRSPIYDAYHASSNAMTSVKLSDLIWLKNNGTPAGKLYAGFLLVQKDPATGQEAFVEFLADNRPLQYQSGCEVLQATVSGIARNILRTGRFLDFNDGIAHGAITNNPLYVQYLMTADRLADATPGESGVHPQYLVYAAAKQNLKELKPDDLNRLLSKASPAGKLYAASLLSLKNSSRDSFEKLTADKSKVTFISGCKGFETTVGEIAKQLKENGNFLSFSIKTNK